MSIPNGSEEEPLTLSELRALAEEYARQQDELASKARGRANQARAKRREVSEKVLLALGGTKADATIVFGSEGEFQLIFRPSKKAAARWTFSIPLVPVSGYDRDRELSKHGRGLWDKEKGEPSLAYRAAEQLLACHAQKLQALRVEVTPLRELSERPETEAVMEQLVKVKELLDTEREQRLRAQAAIGLVVEALSEKLGGIKLKKAFDLLESWISDVRSSGDQWEWDIRQLDIQKLQDGTMFLAATLQRPPTKAELRKYYESRMYKSRMGWIDASRFAKLLRHAGLSWLPSMAQLRRALSPRNLS